MQSACAAYMRLFVMVMVLGVAPLCPSAQTSAVGATDKASKAEQEIRAIEEAEREAMLRGDTAALERYWGKDLVVTAPRNAIRTGAEVLAFVKAGQIKYTSFERRIERISVQGEVGIAMGEETVVSAVGADAGKTLRRRYTDVYARQGGQWRLIARQATLLP